MGGVEAFVGEQLDRALAPLRPFARRRHLRHLNQGQVDAAARRVARETWWGDDPRWYAGGTPPRRHNRVTPLVHGDAYFPELQRALAQATSYVYIVGWCLTPHFPLGRNDRHDLIDTRLLSLLSETAERVPVRVLLWSGAAALIQPTRRAVDKTVRAIESDGHGDLQVRLDPTAGSTHCHHQKAIVIDGQIAFVGGMDLTTFAGDRWDSARHPLRAGVNWHDVQVKLEGEAVADVEHNFRQRWAAVTGGTTLPQREPHVDPAWQTPVQIVRTVPRGAYDFAPRGEFGIHHAYVEALRRARRFVYLESQYLWSQEILDALQEAIVAPHHEPFRIVVLLPARATSGKWDNDRHVDKLRQADDGRGIVSVFCPYTSGPTTGVRAFSYRPIYVHAKLAIVDDTWCTIGSANLNERGLITDGEINAVVVDPEIARPLRIELWAEHLGLPYEAVAHADPIQLVDEVWSRQAAENAAIIERRDGPLVGTLLEYKTGHMPGSWLREEVEVLTFER